MQQVKELTPKIHKLLEDLMSLLSTEEGAPELEGSTNGSNSFELVGDNNGTDPFELVK